MCTCPSCIHINTQKPVYQSAYLCNQPITWQQVDAFSHAETASQWGEKGDRREECGMIVGVRRCQPINMMIFFSGYFLTKRQMCVIGIDSS